MRFSNTLLLNRGLPLIAGLAVFFIFFFGKEEPLVESPPSLELYALSDTCGSPLDLWGSPLSDQMVMNEYRISPKESFWKILEKESLAMAPAWKQQLLSQSGPEAQLLHHLQAHEKIGFVSDQGTLNYILINRDGSDLLIAQQQVRPLQQQDSISDRPVRVDIKIRKGVFRDLSSYKVPAPIINQLTQALGTRFNLSKEVYAGNRLQLLYEKTAQGRWKLHKFSFNNGKKKVTAYAYDFDGAKFVDDQGLALKKGFLEKPVEPSYISSYFTIARKHPVLGVTRAHKGVDFAAAKGTPIKATLDGTVFFVGVRGGYGNLVEIDHGQGVHTRYGHLDSFAKALKKGDKVQQGQVIGAVGMTGLATGPHLHYEHLINGTAVDPLKAQKNPCKKLSSQDQIAFKKAKDQCDRLEQSLSVSIKN